jgi:hypothetical protein
MNDGKFQCGVIEGFYDEMRKRVPREKGKRLTARTKKSWPDDPAYEAGYAKGVVVAKEGGELPGEKRMYTWYLGYRYGEE